MANWRGFFGSLFGRSQIQASAEEPAVSAAELSKNRRPEPERRKPAAPVAQRAGELYQPGDVIDGELEIQRKLGEGGFGLVYGAYSRSSGGVVALKTFRDEFLADGAARDAFKKEALLWVGLEEHPFVLAARWVTQHSGRLFVVMDYIRSDERNRVNLQDHLAYTNGPLPIEQTLRWGVQCCHGMEHATAHGINCHRDIKPDNILIASDGTPKITDFGLAAAAEEVWSGRRSLVSGAREGRPGYSLLMTEGRKVCGTPGYIAPEVYEGKGADVRSDVYSFGIVLWQMATGSAVAPFVDTLYRGDPLQYQQDVYERILAGDLPSVDGPLQGVIKRCLAHDQSQRWRDFGELRVELEASCGYEVGRSAPIPELPDETAVFWSNKGASLGCLGRYEEAIRCCDKALDIDPQYTRAWNNKSNSLKSLGRYEEAIRCCDKALEIDPQYLYAWNNKSNSLKSLGRYEEAIRCHDQALKIDPLNADAWLDKGNGLNNLGRYEEAIRCYDRALKIDPLDAYAWNGKGASLTELGRYEEAIRCYDQALEIDPQYAYAWKGKGKNFNELGRYEEAIRCVDEALKIDPRYAGAWIDKGNGHNNLSRYEEAIRCYDRALEIDPRYAGAWYNKAIAEERLGRCREAAQSYRKFIQLDPPQYASLIAQARRNLQELER